MAARVFVARLGVVSPLGTGLGENLDALVAGRSALAALPAGFPGAGLVAASVADEPLDGALPRTHRLALRAAQAACAGEAPDCVIVGTTTGGIDRTEDGLRAGITAPAHYAHHGAATVATTLADALGCAGPAFSVATACSSGAVAIAIALGLLRAGVVNTALAGGADALCRLTLHGFRLLQLVDPDGARPLDRARAGTSLGEAAALLWLVAAQDPPAGALAELVGAGLSCDAFHATKPLPGGEQAAAAIARALADGGLEAARIGYVNLHGTGTPDNDAAEARAIRAHFAASVPVSSTKGATGHTLAAAGALEASLAIGALERGCLLPNVGLRELDPTLGLEPCREATPASLDAVLSTSFGFGGNNAALVFARASAGGDATAPRASVAQGTNAARPLRRFSILASACASPAGDTASTLEALAAGSLGEGPVPDAVATGRLDPRVRRRLKRLTSIVLSLAEEVRGAAGVSARSVAFGTAWGSLEDTHAFLAELFTTDEKLASPTAFIGSVHNAPAGQAALGLGATGPNLTTPSGRTSFEAALLAAAATLAEGDLPLLLLGADEHHPVLSPLLEPGVAPRERAAALLLGPATKGAPCIATLLHRRREPDGGWIPPLLAAVERDGNRERVAAVLVSGANSAELAALAAALPSARVVAREPHGDAGLDAVFAARAVGAGELPAGVAGATPVPLLGRSVLLLTVDERVGAIEVGAHGA